MEPMSFSTAWVVGGAFIGVFLTVAGWFVSAIVKGFSEKRKSTDNAISDLRDAHQGLEVRIARDYISVETFRLFEQRLVDTLRDLGSKVDTLLSRNNETPRRRNGDK